MKSAYTTAAFCASLFLVACAGSNSGNNIPSSIVAPGRVKESGPADLARTNVRAAYKGLEALYVVDKNDAVQVFNNGTYTLEATITDGLADPLGDWLDAQGNLYVADNGNYEVLEYKPGASSPFFTYNVYGASGAVTTDRHGDVYAIGSNGSFSAIYEFAQEQNGSINFCNDPTGEYLAGVAVDAAGDVFVADSVTARLIEYKGGLANCNATFLPIGMIGLGVGGLVVDKSADLVVADGKVVDVIAPPYSQVTRTLGSNYEDAKSVSISSDNKLAFVTDVEKKVVYEIDYASGKVLKTLGKKQGLKSPVWAVDGPNAVY